MLLKGGHYASSQYTHSSFALRSEAQGNFVFSRPALSENSDGSFPAPVRLGKNRVAWLENEIAKWIEAIAVAPRERKPAPPRPIGAHKGGRPKKRLAQPNLGAA